MDRACRVAGGAAMMVGLLRNLAALSGLQATLYLVPLVSVPYQVRVLGSDAFGRVALALAVSQYFVLLCDYGFNLSATRTCAMLKEQPGPLATLVSAVLGSRLVLCVAGIPVVALLVWALPQLGGDAPLYLLAYIGVVGGALAPAWLLQGIGRLNVLMACSLAGQLAGLLGLLAFVHSPADYRVAAGVQGMAALLSALLAWGWLLSRRAVSLRWPDVRSMRDVVREGWPFFLSTASVSLYTTSNTVLLGLVSGPASVAYFAAADKLLRAVQGLLAPVSQAAFPHVVRLTLESRARSLAFVHQLLKWQGLATLALSTFLFVFAPEVTQLLYGADFAGAALVLRWLAPVVLLVGISNVLGVQTMLNFGLQQPFTRILIGSGLVNIVLLLAMAARYGAVGAAASVLCTEALVVAVMAVAVQRAGLLPAVLGVQRP